jgi:hypothetical protein
MFRVGRPRADDRRILNGILYVFTTGCRWMNMPPSMVHIRLLGGGLTLAGVWDIKALASIRGHGIVSVDSSTVEAKKGGEVVGYDGFKHGKGTKIHACVNRDSMPLNVIRGLGMTLEGF